MNRIILFLLIFFASSIKADAPEIHNFLIKSTNGMGYIWIWQEFHPVIVSEMCWDSNNGFACDNRLINSNSNWVYEIYDTVADKNGSIYELGAECYVFWWHRDYGNDGMPHVSDAYWIECPEMR